MNPVSNISNSNNTQQSNTEQRYKVLNLRQNENSLLSSRVQINTPNKRIPPSVHLDDQPTANIFCLCDLGGCLIFSQDLNS